MRPRGGFTLTEVLMALLCMAIGMISVLALYPVGLENMNQAIHANRVAAALANAEAAIELFNLRGTSSFDTPSQPSVDRNVGGAAVRPAVGSDNGPGRTLLVDPLGAPFLTSSTRFVGDVERLDQSDLPGPLRGTAAATTWCSLADGIVLDRAGASAYPGQVARERLYSWFYLWRRPRWSDAGIVDMSIVICSGRPLDDGTANDGVRSVGATFIAGRHDVSLQSSLNVRAGEWIFDATATNGYFYRVASVNSNGTRLYLDTPARADGRVAAFVPYVVEVVERNSRLFAK